MSPGPLVALFLVASCTLSVSAGGQTEVSTPWSGTVTHVTDGDTLWVRPRQGGAPRVIRLEGMDAPEICQAYGPAAREALAAQVQGRTVQVVSRRHDDYGRLLARIKVKGRDVGGWMVAHGQAWSYGYRRDRGPYARQEAQARAAQLGLFADARAEPPREFRKRHGACH
jgi:micrococcal nuclease